MDASQNVVNGAGRIVELGSDCDDESFILTLLDREARSFGGQQRGLILHPDWVLRARLDGIQYILRTRERLGFGVLTAYASATYLDRFLSSRSIDGEKYWAVRLLSVACLSLAAKMEEITVPALSGFCSDEYSFESSVVQRMELLVLNTLGWEMRVVSPFDFVHFFGGKFFDSTVRNGESRTVEIILDSMRDLKIMCNYRPSVVAAAATLIVLDQGMTREALLQKISPLDTLSFSFQNDEIIACYHQILELDNEGMRWKKGIKSPDLSPIRHQLHTHGSSSVTSSSAAGSSRNVKRRRLVFNEDADDKKSEKP